MTNVPPQAARPAAPAGAVRRQVAVPGGQKTQRRSGLAVFGLVLVLGCGFGFWLILRSVDQRGEYLVAARTFQRWDIAGASDFIVVEANVGTASAVTPDQRGLVVGMWATGRIPQGTLITPGLFETPPLSSDFESDKVQVRFSLPSGDAPDGSLSSGETIALLGRESSGPDGGQGDLALIGVLQLEIVRGDEIHYVVAPGEALQIKRTVDRYNQASDRLMWKLGFNLSAEDLAQALTQSVVGLEQPLDGFEPDAVVPEPVEGQ